MNYARVRDRKEHPQPQEQVHGHGFDIKSSKVFAYMVVTTAVCLVSLVSNQLLTNMLFADKLKELREGKQLLQRQLASALETDTPMYSRIERGERKAG